MTWHYRGADPEVGTLHAQECRRALESQVVGRWDIDVMSGKANLEVRPSFVNKGEIAKRLVLRDQESPPDFVMCLGDDFTDEGGASLFLVVLLYLSSTPPYCFPTARQSYGFPFTLLFLLPFKTPGFSHIVNIYQF